jgi:hypothetical protein
MTELTLRNLTRAKPGDRVELHGWLWMVLGIDVPPVAVCADHDSPLDYLEHVFFEHEGDAVVWANRGGGKTFYGAVATLLDLLFKPGIEIRILGGSLDQSNKMYGYLREFLERPGLRERVKGRMGARRVELYNGSKVELLCQAETSVRGQRVQKLRCDEVDLFEDDVWQAAQFVTRSAWCGGERVRGSVEALSTMNKTYGLMRDLCARAEAGDGWKLFRWCALDVIARCEQPIECEACPLLCTCAGRARHGRGFVEVEDVLAQQARSSAVSFDSEMLCRLPSKEDLVYPMFHLVDHVRSVGSDGQAVWIGGMDFGVRNPTVMLWAQAWREAGGRWRVAVMDEYIGEGRTVEQNMRMIERRSWPRPRWVGVDPAGGARNDQSGISNVEMLRRMGWSVRSMQARIAEGIEVVRGFLAGADGQGRLTVDPRCTQLTEALATYHFDPRDPGREEPVKDGSDHAADALRYMLTNLVKYGGPVQVRKY